MSNSMASAVALPATPDAATTRQVGESYWHSAWRQLRRHRFAMIGLVVLAVLILLSVFAPMVTPFEPDRTSLRERFLPPSTNHWMGTDELGRDVFTRLLYRSEEHTSELQSHS